MNPIIAVILAVVVAEFLLWLAKLAAMKKRDLELTKMSRRLDVYQEQFGHRADAKNFAGEFLDDVRSSTPRPARGLRGAQRKLAGGDIAGAGLSVAGSAILGGVADFFGKTMKKADRGGRAVVSTDGAKSEIQACLEESLRNDLREFIRIEARTRILRGWMIASVWIGIIGSIVAAAATSP